MSLKKYDFLSERSRKLDPYVPGKSIDEMAKEKGIDPSRIVKLSSNENPLGSSKKVLKSLQEIEEVHRYPSPVNVERLEEAVARYVGVERENIFVTPGGDGAIEYICSLFIEQGDLAVSPIPTFQYYRSPVVLSGGDFEMVEAKKSDNYRFNEKVLEKLFESDPGVVFLCSPNNPTGSSVTDGALKMALEGERIVVLDAAYSEFSDKERASWVKDYENLIVLRTFSKAFGLAGMRVGYAVIPSWMKKELSRVATPFSVNVAGLKLAKRVLEDKSFLEKTVKVVKEGRKYLLNNFPFESFPSEANFVAFDVSPFTASEVEEGLLSRGVIVRDCSSFPGETKNLIRVSVGKRKENKKAVSAAKDFLEDKN